MVPTDGGHPVQETLRVLHSAGGDCEDHDQTSAQIYIPSYIYVLISFITFVIELKALPARVILTVNTLMSLCLQFGNIIGSLPPVSYVKVSEPRGTDPPSPLTTSCSPASRSSSRL